MSHFITNCDDKICDKINPKKLHILLNSSLFSLSVNDPVILRKASKVNEIMSINHQLLIGFYSGEAEFW